jgi:hypothetical protein
MVFIWKSDVTGMYCKAAGRFSVALRSVLVSFGTGHASLKVPKYPTRGPFMLNDSRLTNSPYGNLMFTNSPLACLHLRAMQKQKGALCAYY